MAVVEAEIMNLKKSRRKTKRVVNQLRKKAGWGKYVLDCRGHPCIVTEVEFYSSDLYGNGVFVKSLFDDSTCSCSLLHCRPEPITEKEAHSFKDQMNRDRVWLSE